MAEPAKLFDPTAKKKKRPVAPRPDSAAVPAAASTSEVATPATAPAASISVFDSTQKKKRKVPKEGATATAAVVAESAAEEDVEAAADSTATASAAAAAASPSANDDDTDGLGAAVAASGLEDEIQFDDVDIEECPWYGSDREYTYLELLTRVFATMKRNNHELAGGKARISMKPPEVFREGTKKVVLTNFQQICTAVHRTSEHVLSFLLAELGTNGSLDGSGRLVIKGRFPPKAIEVIVRRYIVEYVICKVCKSSETILTKENRLYFMQCEHCGARRSVAAIKMGFQAQIGKRKKAKA